MSKNIPNVLALLVLALCALAACSAPPAEPALRPSPPAPTALISPTSSQGPNLVATAPITVTILHTNDMHGYLEGERLQSGDGIAFEFGGIANALGTIARVKQEVGPNTLTLDGGDFWQGTFASNRDEGRSIIAAMKLVGYDALTPGNHDFDRGVQVVTARAAEAGFPFLAANLKETSTGRPPAWVTPYIVKEIAGIRFGVIGLTNSGTPAISSKSQELKQFDFVRESDALQEILPEVRRKSDIIVLLAHEGLDRDQQLAADIPGIDVIVSGHTHLEQRMPKVVGNTIIVHAGSKAQYIGRLELTIDPASKKILDYTKRNEIVAAVSNKAAPPPEVSAMLGKLVADARDELNRPLGETLTDLNTQRLPDGRTTGEYPLGNLVVDAMLAANQAGERPADLAIHNQGIRADLPRGTITFGKLYDVLPFDNTLAALDLKGEDLKAILEIATSCPRVNTLVAGMTFAYDCSKPQGNRVSQILIQGQPFDPQKTYRVQTIDYLAGGGDGQTPFKLGRNITYGDPVVYVVADYVSRHSPLDLKVEGRIVPVEH